jgi:hypothetical protein
MNNFIQKTKLAANKAMFAIDKKKPEILLATGIVGVVATVVTACKATTKVDDILQETSESIDKVHEARDRDDIPDEAYTHEDSIKDLAIIYVKAGVELGKIYAPSFVIGAASIACILSSYHILSKRNAALASAYAALSTSFGEYRKRVADKVGAETELDIFRGIKAEKVTKTETDEDGNEKEIEEEIKVLNGSCSPYSRRYDHHCANWEDDASMNFMFLRQAQQYMNDLLRTRGHLFLNEVYDYLGMERSAAGQVVGWLYDEKRTDNEDNFVDFGLYDGYIKKENGYDNAILLDFNVNGDIYNKVNLSKF